MLMNPGTYAVGLVLLDIFLEKAKGPGSHFLTTPISMSHERVKHPSTSMRVSNIALVEASYLFYNAM
jgi:hypothetical protein